jgi:hypothetical protein
MVCPMAPGPRITRGQPAIAMQGEVQALITCVTKPMAALCGAGSPPSFTSPAEFKGYTVHPSIDEPQYESEGNTTDHVAIHKGIGVHEAPAVNPQGRCREGPDS